VEGSEDMKAIFNKTHIDISKVRGSGKYIIAHEIPCAIAHRALTEGVLFILDPHNALEGALTEKAVRDAIRHDLDEAACMASEASQSTEDYTEEEEIARDHKRNENAKITIEKIKSPKTGKRGWRVRWAA